MVERHELTVITTGYKKPLSQQYFSQKLSKSVHAHHSYSASKLSVFMAHPVLGSLCLNDHNLRAKEKHRRQ